MASDFAAAQHGDAVGNLQHVGQLVGSKEQKMSEVRQSDRLIKARVQAGLTYNQAVRVTGLRHLAHFGMAAVADAPVLSASNITVDLGAGQAQTLNGTTGNDSLRR